MEEEIQNEVGNVHIDPILDIIEYLVRCANITFRSTQINESEMRTADKIRTAHDIYKQSPTIFLQQYGKYFSPHHIQYFESQAINNSSQFKECIRQLKIYHSDEFKHKRTRNRRYNALHKLKEETDYFSEKQMMFRNPLLYEQLVGQYLTDEEICERDEVDHDNLTLLKMILETVDRNQLRETKHNQLLKETSDQSIIDTQEISGINNRTKGHWGDFDVPDTKPSHIPEKRKKVFISAPEKRLLHREFIQEMYSSFIDGRDSDFDYESIDNDEQYDDLEQVSQDAEDKYFDSEPNEVDSLEEHMQLVHQYGKQTIDKHVEDPLDVFMLHLNKKQN